MTAKPLRILLIEDDDFDAMHIQRGIADSPELDIVLKRATTLGDGLAMAKTNEFDVLLLDLNLPDQTGRASFIHAHSAVPSLPILVLSGAGDRETALWAVRNGAQDYLLKDRINAPALIRAISHARERSALLARINASARSNNESKARIRQRLVSVAEQLAALTPKCEGQVLEEVTDIKDQVEELLTTQTGREET